MSIVVNGKEIQHFNFPGGECHVRLGDISIGDTVAIIAHLYNADDILRLLLSVNAIRTVNPHAVIDLTLPYFPYARQDRVCNPGEAFSAKVMADLINSMALRQVRICDPHSQITVDLIERCHVIGQADILAGSAVEQLIREKSLTLISPDKGAAVRIQPVLHYLQAQGIAADSCFCTKVRDPLTGEITKTDIPENVAGKDFIMIDDICDGGRTFIELAKVLKEHGAGALYLYVTHGIFSKGLDVLRPYFNHVYCLHSFLAPTERDDQFLTMMEYLYA
ncbi:MAG: ribose-phosphate diphosphokinase [Pseudomonadota bacterium]